MNQHKKIKTIAIVMENLSYGGATTHLNSLINSKKFSEFRFLIITNKNNIAQKQFSNIIKKNDFNLLTYYSLNLIKSNNYLIKIFFLIFRPLFFFISIFQMFLILKKNKFDILLADCGGYGNFRTEMAAILAAKFLKKKNLFLLIHHNYSNPLLWKYLIDIINIFISKATDGIIFVSLATKLSIKQNTKLLNFFKKKKIVIHNGVELKKVKYKNLSYFRTARNIIKIGMLSRVEKYKGQEDLIDAVNGLPKEYKDKLKVFFIGSGKKKDILRLKKKIKDNYLNKNFQFINYLNIDSLIIIKNFDLTVSLTRDFEAFGYSIAESLYAGVPVISTKVGGVREYLNTQNAVLIKPGDIKTLKKELVKFILIKKNRIKNKKIKVGRNLIIKKLNSEIMSNKYYQFFFKNSKFK